MGKIILSNNKDLNNSIELHESSSLFDNNDNVINISYDDTELRTRIESLENNPQLVIKETQIDPDYEYIDTKFEEINNTIEGLDNIFTDKLNSKADLSEMTVKLIKMAEYIEDVKAIKNIPIKETTIVHNTKLKNLNYVLMFLNIILLILLGVKNG